VLVLRVSLVLAKAVIHAVCTDATTL